MVAEHLYVAPYVGPETSVPEAVGFLENVLTTNLGEFFRPAFKRAVWGGQQSNTSCLIQSSKSLPSRCNELQLHATAMDHEEEDQGSNNDDPPTVPIQLELYLSPKGNPQWL
jgi:hypothetical protein